MKKKFSVERIKELLSELDEFNRTNLAEVELTENGQTIELSENLLSNWRFIGLSNVSFIETEYWNLENQV